MNVKGAVVGSQNLIVLVAKVVKKKSEISSSQDSIKTNVAVSIWKHWAAREPG